jgi:hypothetical protein
MYQELDDIKIYIHQHFEKYPLASISAAYRLLRKRNSVSLFGDYPLLATIISTVSKMGIHIKKAAIARAARQSKELKGKKMLLNQLFCMQLTGLCKRQVLENTRNNSQMDDSLSQQK